MKRNALLNKVIRTGKMVLPLYLFTFKHDGAGRR